MKVNILGVGKVAVNIARVIEVGKRYRINSSYGFAGIADGIVTVVGLEDPDTMDDDIKRHTVDAWIDTTYGDDSEDGDKLREHYETTMYVAYEYDENHCDTLYMPIDLFVEHISMM